MVLLYAKKVATKRGNNHSIRVTMTLKTRMATGWLSLTGIDWASDG